MNLNFVGRAVLGWTACANKVQEEIVANLQSPKVKVSKKKSKKLKAA